VDGYNGTGDAELFPDLFQSGIGALVHVLLKAFQVAFLKAPGLADPALPRP
jgi:hypothetical protein